MILTVYLILLVAAFVFETWLDLVNVRHGRLQEGRVPRAFAGAVSAEHYTRSIEYTRAKIRFGLANRSFSVALLTVLVVSGAFGFAQELAGRAFGGPVLRGLLLVTLVFAFLQVLEIPWSVARQFRLEERFGFNRSTPATFVADLLKGWAMFLVLGLPLLAGLIWFVVAAGAWWWVYAFVAFFLFQLVVLFLYPMVLAPLFNRFERLEAGSLRERLEGLAERLEFPVKDIFVMDGSRRSAHSNAYFTGFGASRRIVLYDTLIEQMDEEEIEAVLAHEIGHWKRGHLIKRLVFSFLLYGAMFYAAGLLYHWGGLFRAFSFSGPEPGGLFILLGVLMSPLGTLLAPLSNAWSRKHEFEADAYAVGAGVGRSLISALVTLSAKNLSNLSPHPVYSAVHYSHPAPVERVHALEEAINRRGRSGTSPRAS